VNDRLDKLIAELRASDAKGRDAAQVLADHGQDAVPFLIEALSSNDPSAREQAAWALGQIGPEAKSAIKPLIEALRDDAKSVRENAALALGSFGADAAEAVSELVAVLRDDNPGSGNAKEFAAITLAAIGPPVIPSLLELLDCDAEDTCGYAAIALKELGPAGAEAVPGLLRHLSHESRFVRHSCVWALGAIGSAAFEAIEPLIAMMGAAGHDVGQRRYAADALIGIGESSVRPVLLSDLGKTDEALEMPPQIRFDDEVLRIIREIGAVAIPDVMWGLKMGSPASERAYALLEQWDEQVVAYLEEALQDKDIVIRSKAAELLRKRRDAASVIATSLFKTQFSAAHDRLLALLHSQKDAAKTVQRLRTFAVFVEHGSFRKVAALEAESHGFVDEAPDHSGPAKRIKKLAQTLNLPLTCFSEGPGLRRAELTDAGLALADWIKANPSWLA